MGGQRLIDIPLFLCVPYIADVILSLGCLIHILRFLIVFDPKREYVLPILNVLVLD